MIEGLQVAKHMPLFNIQAPGNVNAFNEFVAEIANFDLVDTSGLTSSILYFPEEDPVSVNFQNAGV